MWGAHLNAIGAYVDALKQLESARASGFKSDRMWFELGYAHNATRQFDKAASVLQPTVDANPNAPEMLGKLAFTRLQQRDFKSAIDLYNRAISKFGDGDSDRKAEFAHNLSNAYHANGDAKAAEEWRGKSEAWSAQEQSR